MSLIEIVGFVFGISGVWLTMRQNIWCFPIGLINVMVSMILFLDQKLYSDSIQQLAYIFLLSYGWYRWYTGKRDFSLPVSYSSAKQLGIIAVITTVVAFGMGFFFHRFTDADVPYLDASATALSFAAQWLIARKKIENWLIWIVVNLMYIGIYFYKDLFLYALLFSVYLVLAFAGFNSWKKQLNPASIKN